MNSEHHENIFYASIVLDQNQNLVELLHSIRLVVQLHPSSNFMNLTFRCCYCPRSTERVHEIIANYSCSPYHVTKCSPWDDYFPSFIVIKSSCQVHFYLWLSCVITEINPYIVVSWLPSSSRLDLYSFKRVLSYIFILLWFSIEVWISKHTKLEVFHKCCYQPIIFLLLCQLVY